MRYQELKTDLHKLNTNGYRVGLHKSSINPKNSVLTLTCGSKSVTITVLPNDFIFSVQRKIDQATE